MSELRGTVFDIQRFSLHDGPGIRTLVFLKGCPLSCIWCCNPESQRREPQIGYNMHKCISCNECLEACPYNAITVKREGRSFDIALCDTCRDHPCVAACPSGAVELYGKLMTVEEVVRQVVRDELFYRQSGGGVTMSGGEPLAQADFVEAVFRECRKTGYSTAVETSGYCGWDAVEKVLPVTDYFLFDIKHINREKHIRFIGADNDIILENLKKLSRRTSTITVRIPLVPGFNDDESSLAAIADFSRDNGISGIHILPYHRLGRSKYDQLFVPYKGEDIPLPSQAEIDAAVKIIETRGLRATVGG